MKRGFVFISYRRDGGSDLARNVRDALRKRRFEVFMDVEDLRSGAFNTALYERISAATDVVVILSPGCLDRCFDNEGDWLRCEIAHALKKQKNVVPIFSRGFQWPKRALPGNMSDLSHQNGLVSSHDYFDASMDRLADRLLIGRGTQRSWWSNWLTFRGRGDSTVTSAEPAAASPTQVAGPTQQPLGKATTIGATQQPHVSAAAAHPSIGEIRFVHEDSGVASAGAPTLGMIRFVPGEDQRS